MIFSTDSRSPMTTLLTKIDKTFGIFYFGWKNLQYTVTYYLIFKWHQKPVPLKALILPQKWVRLIADHCAQGLFLKKKTQTLRKRNCIFFRLSLARLALFDMKIHKLHLSIILLDVVNVEFFFKNIFHNLHLTQAGSKNNRAKHIFHI